MLLAGLGLTLPETATIATAQAQPARYPERPIRFVVPYPAGGTSDVIARAFAQEMAQDIGKPLVIDNKGGANGIIGMAAIAHSVPDGYTIGLGATTTVALNPLLYSKLPYDPKNDVEPIAAIASSKVVLVVNPGLGVENLEQLIRRLKEHPGAYNYGSPGVRHSYYLLAGLFKRTVGVEMVHVPYRGDKEAMTELIGGRIHLMFTTVVNALPFMSSGQIRAIALVSRQRSAKLPDVPTFKELGIEGFEDGSWFGIVAPGKTPAALVGVLGEITRKAVASNEVATQFETLGTEPTYMDHNEFAAYIASETEKWGRVVKDLDIQEEAP